VLDKEDLDKVDGDKAVAAPVAVGAAQAAGDNGEAVADGDNGEEAADLDSRATAETKSIKVADQEVTNKIQEIKVANQEVTKETK